MSTTEETNTIDEKKAEESGTSTTSIDFKGFISNYLSSIIFTIGISIFVIGGLGLYTTKVAQSNILPDNIEQAPYTIIDRVVENIPVDINIIRPTFWSENKDTFSQKAVFNSQEYLDSFSNSFLCSLKSKADPKSGSNAALFFSRVYDNLVAKNLLAINTIFLYLSYFPESIIMLLYGFFGIFIWFGLYLFNMCISIFYHFINIPELFRASSNISDNNTDAFEWESDDNISYIRLLKLLFFFFIWFPIGLISTFVMPTFFTIYGLISPLFATYNINKTRKTYSVYDFIIDTFAYKKLFFFILATVSLFTNGIKYLGNNSVIGIIVAVMFAYFMGLYNNEMPDINIDGFTSKIRENIKQAKIARIDETKLVEICNQIVIDDDKIKKIIANGTFRKLTKPTGIGGDRVSNNAPPPVSTNPPILTNPFAPTVSNNAPTVSNNAPPVSTNPFAPPVSNNAPPVSTNPFAPPTEQQMGGKKHKTKKYNIRLV